LSGYSSPKRWGTRSGLVPRSISRATSAYLTSSGLRRISAPRPGRYSTRPSPASVAAATTPRPRQPGRRGRSAPVSVRLPPEGDLLDLDRPASHADPRHAALLEARRRFHPLAADDVRDPVLDPVVGLVHVPGEDGVDAGLVEVLHELPGEPLVVDRGAPLAS